LESENKKTILKAEIALIVRSEEDRKKVVLGDQKKIALCHDRTMNQQVLVKSGHTNGGSEPLGNESEKTQHGVLRRKRIKAVKKPHARTVVEKQNSLNRLPGHVAWGPAESRHMELGAKC